MQLLLHIGLTPSAEGAVSSYQALQLLATMPTPMTPKPDLNALLSEDSQSRSDSRALAPLQQLRFYWKVDMELRAIYDLMLDEQKESLHDRVVSNDWTGLDGGRTPYTS